MFTEGCPTVSLSVFWKENVIKDEIKKEVQTKVSGYIFLVNPTDK